VPPQVPTVANIATNAAVRLVFMLSEFISVSVDLRTCATDITVWDRLLDFERYATNGGNPGTNCRSVERRAGHQVGLRSIFLSTAGLHYSRYLIGSNEVCRNH